MVDLGWGQSAATKRSHSSALNPTTPDLAALHIRTANGHEIPLAQVARLELRSGQLTILQPRALMNLALYDEPDETPAPALRAAT